MTVNISGFWVQMHSNLVIRVVLINAWTYMYIITHLFKVHWLCYSTVLYGDSVFQGTKCSGKQSFSKLKGNYLLENWQGTVFLKVHRELFLKRLIWNCLQKTHRELSFKKNSSKRLYVYLGMQVLSGTKFQWPISQNLLRDILPEYSCKLCLHGCCLSIP